MQERIHIFQDIPALEVPGAPEAEVVDCGAGNYVATVERTTGADYRSYLASLEKAGFAAYADNGSGLHGSVFFAVYTKEHTVVTVTHVARQGKTYISVCRDLPLSEHLLRREAFVSDVRAGAKTSIHMLELCHFGNSFVIQLKNGHFIVSDGGMKMDLAYLLDYLERLAPEGEVPVVEAWIFTHGHGDHCGVMGAFVDEPELAKRLFVEGIYYNEPSGFMMDFDFNSVIMVSWIKAAAKYMSTTKGTAPRIYRPQTGQRYYFSDITMDIVVGQEQVPREDYSGDFNDSTTWCMFTIEGQKCLFCGDGDTGGMKFLMEAYDRDYLALDVFTLQHHGWNTRDYFVDYCTVKTVLVTGDKIPVKVEQANAYFHSRVEEWLAWEDGTEVLTFPYTVGSFQTVSKPVHT